jgi:large subunit ribosomal protein L2
LSNGVRHKVSLSSFSLNSVKLKKLSSGFKNSSGRSSSGKITVFSKSRRVYNYIFVDYLRSNSTDIAVCVNNIKNTSTNNIISLIKFSNGSYAYILNTYGFSVGMLTSFLSKHLIFSTKYTVGSVVFLKNLDVGSIFYNVCNLNKSLYARSPGTYCILLNIDYNKSIINIQLPSGKNLNVDLNSFATLGRNSNIWKFKEIIGKAGRNVLRGFKPSVRGVAMNPVDHPHGGRTKTNSPEKTP